MPTTLNAPPNEHTLAMARMEHHYASAGLLDIIVHGNQGYKAPAWSSARVDRFCNMRGCSLPELALFFLVPYSKVQGYYESDSWPSVLALHMQHHEAYMVSQLTTAEQLIFPPKVFVDPPEPVCPTCGRRNRHRQTPKSSWSKE